MRVDAVHKLPECAVTSQVRRALRRFRLLLGVLVERERELTEDPQHFVPIRGQNLLVRGVRAFAEGAFKIGIFDDDA